MAEDAKALIELATRRFIEEVPALEPIKLIVGVDGQRRTIILPSALAAYQPTAATFEDGTLEVTFDGAS